MAAHNAQGDGGHTTKKKVPAWAPAAVAVLVTGVLYGATAAPFARYPGTRAAGVDAVQPGALVWAALGFTVPILVFALGGAAYDQSFWDFLGCFRNVPMTSCEAEVPKAFMKRWRNAHSSNAQISAGCYVLYYAANDAGSLRAVLATTFLGTTLVMMGVVSYMWWASRREIMWRLDHTFMEAMTLGLAVLFLSIAHPAHEASLVAAAACVTALRGFTHNGSALGVYGVVAYSSGIYAMHVRQGTGSTGLFLWAFGTTLYGFVFKIADVAELTHWGTSWFHLLAAVGFALFFVWAETLP